MRHEADTPDLEVIHRFRRALDAALHDRAIERSGETISYYYDADVMVAVVGGLLDRNVQITAAYQRMNLVRALLSSGFLGKIRMLRPHVLELDSEVRGYPDLTRKGHAGDYARRVRAFIESHGVAKEMENLRTIIKSKTNDNDIVRAFIHFMQESGYRSFPILEMANGTWVERLRRLMSYNFAFEGGGPDLRSVLESTTFIRVHESLTQESGLHRSAGSNLRDATALALLHEAVVARDSGEQTPYVRFYTETTTLQRLWARHSAIRKMLTYNSSVEPSDFDFVVRDPDYYILRAAFQELRFPGVDIVERSGGEATWDELVHIASELRTALSEGTRDVREHLETLELGGVRLREVVEEFESLALLRNVWSNYSLPESLQKHIPSWTDTWDFTGSRFDQVLRQELQATRSALHREVENLQSWTSRCLRIAAAADDVRNRFGDSDAPLPDPMRDLGLVRWGITLSDGGRERLQEYVATILRGNFTERLSLCGTLAGFVDQPDSTTDAFGVVSATLWFLEQFDLISETIRNYVQNARGVLEDEFKVIDIVARLKADQRMDTGRKTELLQQLERVDTLAEKTRAPRYLLALGYAYFVAWSSELRARQAQSIQNGEDDDLLRKWAQRSFVAGIAGAKTYMPHTLEWAFSINHIVYVGTVTSQALGEVQGYVELLITLRGQPAFWHYRFADTLAYHNYTLAKMEWQLESLRARGSRKGLARVRVCRLLNQASELLAEAKFTYGDPEIPQHKLEIARLIADVGCE